VLETLLNLIDGIYAAALDSALWPQCLQQIADIVGAERAALQSLEANSLTATIHAIHGWPPELLAPDILGCADLDLLARDALTKAEGEIYHEGKYPNQSEFPKSVAKNEFFAKYDAEHLLGALVTRTPNYGVLLSCRRGRRRGPFNDNEQHLFSVLLPNLKRAFQVHRQMVGLDLRGNLFADALDQLQIAIFVLNCDGRVLHMNGAAKAMLGEKDGLKLTRRQIMIATRPGGDILARLIADAVRPGGCGGTMTMSRPSCRRDYQLVVAPLPSRHPGFAALPQGCALVFVNDPTKLREPPLNALMGMYGLTRAEARLAAYLSTGNSLAEWAHRSGTSYNTARTHLKHVFDKTGVTRQADLAALFSAIRTVAIADTT
jgi:DNA-binding CsgD family transcriptional regulator/PAS domain-containing protein